MKIRVLLLLLPLLLLLAPLAASGAETPVEVMNRVQAKYDKTAAFQARFQQESQPQGDAADR